jgi:hypothetical protein
MKKFLLIFVCCLFLILGCKGDPGPLGPSGADGKDAIVSRNIYYFTPSSNPYMESIAEIDFTKFKAGDQIIQVYMSWATNEWKELPVYFSDQGAAEAHNVNIGSNYIELISYVGGAYPPPLTPGSACRGVQCMALIINLN